MPLSSRARVWRGECRRAIVLEACARVAGSSLAFFSLMALADGFFILPKQARSFAWAGWACWLVWTLARRLWRDWRAVGWNYVFEAAARRWPETRLLLSSAWGLSEAPAPRGISEELRAEHLRRADLLAENLPEEPLAIWSPSPAVRRTSAAAFVLLLAGLAFGGRASWKRVLVPWNDAALENLVEISPGDGLVDWGSPASIRVRVLPGAAAAGLRASALVFEARGSGGTWREAEWTHLEAGGAVWSSPSLSERLDYRVRWRGLIGRAYRLEPVAPPRWRLASAEVRGPRAKRRFILGEESSIRARRGDWVVLEAEADVPLLSAELRLSGSPPQPMRQDGRLWRAAFSAQEDAVLSFGLVGADGRRDPSPPAYGVSVAADAPPTVEILSPQVPLVASPEDSIPLAYAARDDGAVTRLTLVVRSAGRPDRVISLPAPDPPQDEILGDCAWSLSGLPVGTRAEFWIEATDDASPPQSARSEKGSVEVVDAAAEHAAALAAREAAQAALEQAAARAEGARDASSRGDLAASRRETSFLSEEWSSAAKALSALARRADADPRGDPDMAEESLRASEEFSLAGSEGLAAAEKALAEGDARAAGREQSALAEQARGVQRALQDSRLSQSFLDAAAGVERSRGAGESLARDAAALAARGPDGSVSASELEALDLELAKVEAALESLRKALKNLPEASSETETRSLPLDDARQAAGDLRRAIASGDVAAAAKAAKRLSESLAGLTRTLERAARRSSESRGRREREAAGGVARSWKEAVELQTRAVEASRSLDEARQKAVVAEQKALLAELAGGQETILSSAAARSGLWPEAATRSASEVVRQFRAGAVTDARARLSSVVLLLRLHAASRPADGAALRAFAGEEEALSARLAAGDSRLSAQRAPSSADPREAREAALTQARARERTESLRAEIVRAARELGFLSARLVRRVDEALAEQGPGESALRRGDSMEGLKRAETALAVLQDGQGEASSAVSSASAGKEASGGAGGGAFISGSVRAAVRGARGSGLGRVRLPSADEYRPPRELREELERSLREPRPAAHDLQIREYFKRLAR